VKGEISFESAVTGSSAVPGSWYNHTPEDAWRVGRPSLEGMPFCALPKYILLSTLCSCYQLVTLLFRPEVGNLSVSLVSLELGYSLFLSNVFREILYLLVDISVIIFHIG